MQHPPKMTNHIIICGYNSIVESLTERLSLLKMPFLIIERSEEVARGIYKKYQRFLVIQQPYIMHKYKW